MSARIKVTHEIDIYVWNCRSDGSWCSTGYHAYLADAADAGRRHLFEQHGRQRIEAVVAWADSQLAYSRECGVPIAACGADTCHCVPVDPDAELGRENAACEVCGGTGHVECWLLECDGPLCECCGPCLTCTNPMQRAHNESRSDT